MEAVALFPLSLASRQTDILPPGLKAQVLNTVATQARPTIDVAWRPFVTGGRIRRLFGPPVLAVAAAVIVVALSIAYAVHQTSALAKERSLRSELAELVGQQQAI